MKRLPLAVPALSGAALVLVALMKARQADAMPPPAMESLRAKHDALAGRLAAAAPSQQERLRIEQAGILAEMERLSDKSPPGVGEHIRRDWVEDTRI